LAAVFEEAGEGAGLGGAKQIRALLVQSPRRLSGQVFNLAVEVAELRAEFPRQGLARHRFAAVFRPD